MGAPSVTNIQDWTDRISALVRAELAAAETHLGATSSEALSVQVDGSGDQSLEAALMPAAISVDRLALPENLVEWIRAIATKTGYKNWCQAVSKHIYSADGGSYSSFRDYLGNSGALLHPLFSEVWRANMGDFSLRDSAGAVGVFPPGFRCAAPSAIYHGADGSLTDLLPELGVGSPGSETIFSADNNALYIGCTSKFSAVVVALSTVASATIQPEFRYWNGNEWAVLSVNNNTSGFTRNDVTTFTPPSDWTRCAADMGENEFTNRTHYYYVRISRTADTLTTPPVAQTIRLLQSPVYRGGNELLGVAQPPLALVRITAANTISVILGTGIDRQQFEGADTFGLRALTPITGTVTMVLSYVDDDGENRSQGQGAWGSISVLSEHPGVLESPGGKLLSVRATGNSSANTATSGVFEVFVSEKRELTL